MRLIDADALKSGIAELKKSPGFNAKEGFAYRKEAIEIVEMLCVDKEPTVDPVRHGGWLVFHPFKCSRCGERSETDTNYCPNCGAKMDGGGEKDGEIH